MIQALNTLHGLGPRIVIITSTNFSDKKDDEIVLYGSQLQDDQKEATLDNILKVAIPIVGKESDAVFTGTGDLLSSMLLAHNEKFPDDLGKTIECAVNIVHQVLLTTMADPLMGTREINLIASKSCIENPKLNLKVQKIH